MAKEYTIRKKIAKHGENSIIVIPKLLKGELKPKTIVEINIKFSEEVWFLQTPARYSKKLV